MLFSDVLCFSRIVLRFLEYPLQVRSHLTGLEQLHLWEFGLTGESCKLRHSVSSHRQHTSLSVGDVTLHFPLWFGVSLEKALRDVLVTKSRAVCFSRGRYPSRVWV